MDKRTVLALLLTGFVIIGLPAMYRMIVGPPPVVTVETPNAPADSLALATRGDTAAQVPLQRTDSIGAVGPGVPATTVAPAVPAVAAETTTVDRHGADSTKQRARYSFLSYGAAPIAAELPQYRALGRGQSGSVAIEPTRGTLLSYRLVRGGRDTIDLGTVPMRVTQSERSVTFTSDSPALTIDYQFGDNGYLTSVRGMAPGVPEGSSLLIELPRDLRSAEADSAEDLRQMAYGYKRPIEDVTSISLGKLDTGVVRTDAGPIDWVSVRSKYFLVALMSADSTQRFTALRMTGLGKRPGGAAMARGTAVLPIRDGRFGFDLYTGPQTWGELRGLGRDMDNVNPYGGWLHGVVQPFATIMMRVLLWMKAATGLNYGWVLVIFGVGVRLLLWPLNQGAMRNSIKMQRLQPELQAVQKRYAKDPEAQRKALLKLYQDHGMSPLSPLLGCLPMLIPMPLLFALYFVFQNTIEFRGVSFLWLPDISLKDPYYIVPLVMGASMFLLSWIGMRAAPPSPQAKMMTYMMPAMFTVMFLNFASGLNLYYAVQNITALPQQLLLARERAKAAPVKPVATTPKPKPRGGGSG